MLWEARARKPGTGIPRESGLAPGLSEHCVLTCKNFIHFVQVGT